MSTTPRCCLFETPLGACGIAWTASGIAALQLPEADARRTLARLLKRLPGAVEAAPPPVVRDAIEAIVRLLGGAPIDLGSIVLDETGVPDFQRRVYRVARAIRCGTTLSYGDVAARIGEPDAARRVGEALGENPFSIVVPCHRVLGAGGAIGGFSARGGIATKRRLLALEHARFGEGPDLFDVAPIEDAGDPAIACLRHDAGSTRETGPPAPP